jgi:hypothetical protein
MPSPLKSRGLALLALSVLCSAPCTAGARAQSGIELQTCEDLKITGKRYDADGKDAEFVNEYRQNIGEANRLYATTGDQISLPEGVYTVYVIAWGKRELLMHNGNLTEYFARRRATPYMRAKNRPDGRAGLAPMRLTTARTRRPFTPTLIH